MDDEMDNTEESPSFASRHVAISVIPHVTGALSGLGSLFHYWYIMKSSKEAWNYLSLYLIGHIAVRCRGELVMAFSTHVASFFRKRHCRWKKCFWSFRYTAHMLCSRFLYSSWNGCTVIQWRSQRPLSPHGEIWLEWEFQQKGFYLRTSVTF